MERIFTLILTHLKKVISAARRGLLSSSLKWVSLGLATVGLALIVFGSGAGCASTNIARSLYPEAVSLAGVTTACVVTHINMEEDLTRSYLGKVVTTCGSQTLKMMSTELRAVFNQCAEQVEDCVVSTLQEYFEAHPHSGSTTELYSAIVEQCVPWNISDVNRWCLGQ
jgi:hypothetical protein